MTNAELEEAAEKWVFENCFDCDIVGEHRANDAFKAGAKWQAEHTPLPEDTVLFNKGVAEGRRLAEEERADLFTIVALDAAQRAKEQMMKEAVEGVVFGNVYEHWVETGIDEKLSYLNPGDKVRVIIVKD